MEATAFDHLEAAPLRGASPLLRLASDERLVAITRRGNQTAFETLVARYNARLLAFCRHMVGSREDAEDVLQEVFAAAYHAMLADERAINVRPWLYRIARNRSLNHLRRQRPIGVDSMDVHVAEQGITTADKVHRREEFRQLMADVQTLPETQRTALLLREIDALRYDQIAEAMDTTIPSVKSLLVRARVSLAEAAEAREMSCEEVRLELGEVAEGLAQRLGAPARRHVRGCEYCAGFRKQLRATNKALAAAFPVGPLLFLKKGLLAHLGTTASAGGAATTAAVAAGTGAGSASLISASIGAVASKTAAGLAAAALVTAGAVEVNHSGHRALTHRAVAAAPAAHAVVPTTEPAVVSEVAQATSTPTGAGGAEAPGEAEAKALLEADAQHAAGVAPATADAVAPQQGSDSTTLPPQAGESSGATPTADGAVPDDGTLAATGGTAAPGDAAAPATPVPAPSAPAGGQADPAPAVPTPPAPTPEPPAPPVDPAAVPPASPPANPAPAPQDQPATGTSPPADAPDAPATTPPAP